MNNQEILNHFGSFLMEQVRDNSIIHWDMVVNGKMKDAHSKEMYGKIQELSPECQEFIHLLIPKIVDTTLHNLLWSLEQEESIVVGVEADTDGIKNIRDISDGLAGELYTEDGWIAKYSNQRHDEE